MAQGASDHEVIRPTPVILVCMNNLALTKLAVRSILAQDTPVEVLAVDNCSTDGTRDWLASKRHPIIFTMRQMSLAWCWNSALRACWHAGHESALVVNTDVELRADTVSMLLAHGGEFVTCVSVDDRERMGTPGDRKIEDLRVTQREHPDYSAWMIRKLVTDKGCWFNEKCFPAYVEDAFHHVACVRAGIRPVCIDLPFYHYAAGTLKNAEAGEQARIRRGADRNRERFRRKYKCVPGTPEYEALFA